MDVFHAHANINEENDSFSRKAIHGLNLDFLHRCGFPSEDELASAFRVWMSRRQIDFVFANGPRKEADYLNMEICHFPLPIWRDRPFDAAHQLALSCKRHETPVGMTACTREIHNAYHPSPPQSNASPGVIARYDFGYHCSLYDSYELYLAMLLNKGKQF